MDKIMQTCVPLLEFLCCVFHTSFVFFICIIWLKNQLLCLFLYLISKLEVTRFSLIFISLPNFLFVVQGDFGVKVKDFFPFLKKSVCVILVLQALAS